MCLRFAVAGFFCFCLNVAGLFAVSLLLFVSPLLGCLLHVCFCISFLFSCLSEIDGFVWMGFFLGGGGGGGVCLFPGVLFPPVFGGWSSFMLVCGCFSLSVVTLHGVVPYCSFFCFFFWNLIPSSL